VIHCTDSQWGEIEEIRRWHKLRGFDDIGYHYLICNRYPEYANHKNERPDPLWDGKVQEGRAEEIAGAHTTGHNAHSLGVALVGTNRFTSAQFESLYCLLRNLMRKHRLGVEDIYGHYEFCPTKSCPNLGMDGFRRDLANYLKL